MPRNKYPPSVRNRILRFFMNHTYEETSRTFGVSKSTLWKWKRKYLDGNKEKKRYYRKSIKNKQKKLKNLMKDLDQNEEAILQEINTELDNLIDLEQERKNLIDD